jgi:sugar-specific transcriptional regulator TrmB
MNYKEVLTKIGMTEKESILYISLIESGPATVSTISKNTGLHRPIIYKVLPGLQEKGLIAVFPKGKWKYYIAESPEKLTTLLDMTKKSVTSMIPELKSMFQTQHSKPTVKYLEGRQGIIFVFDDLAASLKHGEIYYRYSAVSEEAFDKAPYYLSSHYAETMERKNVECFLVLGENIEKKLQSFLWLDVKTIPEKTDLFDHNISQIIYANKVAFIDYNTETALIVENPILATFQKKLFKLLYAKL